MQTVLPANWVAAGYAVPQVCARHGEPAAEGVRTRFQSRPPSWSYVLLILGALPFLIVAYSVRKTVYAPSWPFCAQCKALRTRLLVIGCVTLVAGAALFAGGVVASGGATDGNSVGGLLLLVGLFVAIAGLVVMGLSGRTALARARVSQDGVWVEVLKPDPRFAQQAPQYYAPQPPQPYQPQPYPPQSYAPQPYPPQPYAAQPYAAQPYGQPAFPPQTPTWQQPGGYQAPGDNGSFAPPR